MNRTRRSTAPGSRLASARRILNLLRPHRRRVALSFGLTIAGCLLNLPVPILVQGLIDRVVTKGDRARLPWFASALIGAFAAQACVGLSNTLVIGGVGLQVVRDLRHRMYAHLQWVELSFFDRTNVGVL